MPSPTLHVTDAPREDERAAVSRGLDAFNAKEMGEDDERELAVLVKDSGTDEVVGGLVGRTSFGLLFVDSFHLPPEVRGAGLGSEVLRAAEEEGRRRGCRNAVLYTLSFQAPGFYQRNGWSVFGAIPCEPPGTSRVFMTKEL